MENNLKIEYSGHFSNRVESANKILLLTHSNPDGDAIGSVTAIYKYFLNCNKSCEIWTPNRYPSYLAFLDLESSIHFFNEESELFLNNKDSFDLIICLDLNQIDRLDNLGQIVESMDVFKILIDHHPNPDIDKFDLIFSYQNMSSTCELVFWLLMDIENQNLKYRNYFTTDVAVSIYSGLMTDTNNFSNSVNAETFEAAAELLKRGVDKEIIQHKIFNLFSEGRMRLMGHSLLNKMKIMKDCEAAYIVLTNEDLKKFDFKDGDTEGFVNMPLNIEGIHISALFVENGEYIRVSLRSINDFSVNALSREYFNGGGHERAAGGRLYMPISQVSEYFEEKLRLFKEINR